MSGAGLVYEVDLSVRLDALDAYREWLDAHVREIVALPGFVGATLSERLEPPAEAGHAGLCVQYRLRDQAALDDYLHRHAPRLRAEGLALFDGRFRATRRVLRPLRDY